MRKQKNHSRIYKIDGVGVNLERFHPVSAEEKSAIRAELGYNTADFIITVVAELNKNKNQIMLVRKTAELKAIIPTLKILLIGKETLPIVRDLAVSRPTTLNSIPTSLLRNRGRSTAPNSKTL